MQADRRLGQTNGFSRSGKASMLRNRNQCFQMMYVHLKRLPANKQKAKTALDGYANMNDI